MRKFLFFFIFAFCASCSVHQNASISNKVGEIPEYNRVFLENELLCYFKSDFIPLIRKTPFYVPTEKRKTLDFGSNHHLSKAGGAYIGTKEGGWILLTDKNIEGYYVHEFLHAIYHNTSLVNHLSFRNDYDRFKKEYANTDLVKYLEEVKIKSYAHEKDFSIESFAFIGQALAINPNISQKVPEYIIKYYKKIFIPEVFNQSILLKDKIRIDYIRLDIIKNRSLPKEIFFPNILTVEEFLQHGITVREIQLIPSVYAVYEILKYTKDDSLNHSEYIPSDILIKQWAISLSCDYNLSNEYISLAFDDLEWKFLSSDEYEKDKINTQDLIEFMKAYRDGSIKVTFINKEDVKPKARK